METIVEGIVEKCIQNELIEESQRDWMTYSLQRKFMNFGGFFILVCFGALVAPLPQVILLNFGLAFLREKTNGLHMPTIFSCFITSLFCELPLPAIFAGFHETRHSNLQSQLFAGRRIAPT